MTNTQRPEISASSMTAKGDDLSHGPGDAASSGATGGADLVPQMGGTGLVYAAGFLLDETGRVVLIRKARPAWQAGLLNGVGGKVDPGETPAEAMRREFREEAGLALDGWEHFATVTFSGGTVWFFRLFAPPSVLDKVHACTDEPIELRPLRWVLEPGSKVIENLRWLLPLAAYRHDTYEPLVVREV